MSKKIAVLSGGLDSTVALAMMLKDAPASAPVRALSFDYGQTHRRELEAAERIAAHYGVPHRVVDAHGLLTGGALLGDGNIPTGTYDAEGMAATVVHGRNLLFSSIAVSLAGEGGEVWLGVHGGDHYIYPDCQPTFWQPYSRAVRAAYDVRIVTPFLEADKTGVVRQGAALGAPIDLTYSCYEGGEEHCGECGTCRERREAFRLAGISDATRYAVVQ